MNKQIKQNPMIFLKFSLLGIVSLHFLWLSKGLNVNFLSLITPHVTVTKRIDNILIEPLQFFELQQDIRCSFNDHSFRRQHSIGFLFTNDNPPKFLLFLRISI